MRATSPFLQAPLQEESGNAMRIATRTWSMLLMKFAVYVLFFFLALMNHKMSRRWRHPLLFSIVYRSANGLLLGGHLHGVKVLPTFLRLDWRIVLAWERVLIRLELV